MARATAKAWADTSWWASQRAREGSRAELKETPKTREMPIQRVTGKPTTKGKEKATRGATEKPRMTAKETQEATEKLRPREKVRVKQTRTAWLGT
jgi:hypothetical protein